MQQFLLIAVLLALLGASQAFMVSRTTTGSSTALNAHHVNKKITKRMMDRRPKKSRPSDINRNNVNEGKCITKMENAPAEYTLMSEEDYMKVRADALKFWDNGDSAAEWVEITADDMDPRGLVQSITPLPEGGVQKRPPLVKSGTC
jgi:hypothetical protein